MTLSLGFGVYALAFAKLLEQSLSLSGLSFQSPKSPRPSSLDPSLNVVLHDPKPPTPRQLESHMLNSTCSSGQV